MNERDREDDDLTIGQLLRRLRGDRSLRDVQRQTEISAPYLSNMETGTRKPSVRVLKTLASFYGVPVQDLMRRAGMLEGGEGMKPSEESEVERAYEFVLDDPRFKYGTRMKGPLTLEGKRFIVMMYEKFTGKRLL